MDNGSRNIPVSSLIKQFEHSDGGGSNHLLKLSQQISRSGIPASSLIKQFDHDHDGELQLDEFHDMCAWINRRRMDHSAVETMFKELDFNESGGISQDELELKLLQANREELASFKPHGDYDGHTYSVSLVAHNNMKPVLVEFVKKHHAFFKKQNLCSTTSTGKAIEKSLGICVKNKTLSGPLGGDQELGGMVGHHKLDLVIFFRDPLSSHPHAADVSALLRICDTTSTLLATNPATAHGLVRYLDVSQPDPKNSETTTESGAVKAYLANQNNVLNNMKVDEK